MHTLYTLLLVLTFFFLHVNALSFTLYEGSRKCFAEELPPHTLVRLRYTAEDTAPMASQKHDNNLRANVVVLDPAGRTISSSHVKNEGQVVFTATLGGIYEMCFIADASTWFRTVTKLRFSVNVDVGHAAMDYEAVAKKEQLDTVSLATRQLLDGISEVVEVQRYLSTRETELREFTESARSRVQWMNLFCVFVMFGSAALQMYYMRSYLKKRLKLV
ncbi:hypothetical protein P9112_003816 [Eukaryota sp. TZLM1-RC]